MITNELILRLQREAERIAAKQQLPEFYGRFKSQYALARKLYFTHPLVIRLRECVRPCLSEDLGHGMFHSSRVSIDGATLIHVELDASPMGRGGVERLMILGLVAGLLHDIRRAVKKHAEVGALEAARILTNFPLSDEEVQWVCEAIRNHEAFVAPTACGRPSGQLISDCLYDADKFRWGPDNFTHTLWHMVNHYRMTPRSLIEKFPWGIAGILRIQDTFRTPTGRQYGPEIIEAGVVIGKEIYRYLIAHFGEENDAQ
jgi:hypothetical protein